VGGIARRPLGAELSHRNIVSDMIWQVLRRHDLDHIVKTLALNQRGMGSHERL